MKKNTKGKWHEDMKNQPMQCIKLSQEEWKSKTTDELRRTMQIKPKQHKHNT